MKPGRWLPWLRATTVVLAASSILVLASALGAGACASSNEPDPDAGFTDAALVDAEVDAAPDRLLPDAFIPPDAAPPTSLEMLAPASASIPRGAKVALTITLDRPALAGGALVTLSSSEAATVSVPATVTVPAGSRTVGVDATGVAPGGPVDISASFGAATRMASISVTPALASLTPTLAVRIGSTDNLIVTLDGPAPAGGLTLTTTSTMPTVVGIPAQVTIPAGLSSGGIPVSGLTLGGPVTVRVTLGPTMMTAMVTVNDPVDRLVISEVFYDAAGGDDGLEWIELYNGGATTVDLGAAVWQVRSSNSTAAYSALNATLGAGTIAPGACVVIGGPGGPGGGASYFQVQNFNPDLPNSGAAADAIALFQGTTLMDAVIYGALNDRMIGDETGTPGTLDVGDAAEGKSIQRLGARTWRTDATPGPGNCAPL
ncbi:MAG: lamin tail domain-containing protein [Deltaproteobacteria bacterium]|nr:lamin tail domain-containing protein [Deltaproteobacteria bacterium]